MTTTITPEALERVNALLGKEFPDDPLGAIKAQRVILAALPELLAAQPQPADCVYATNTGEKDADGNELYTLTDRPFPMSEYQPLYRKAQPASSAGGQDPADTVDPDVVALEVARRFTPDNEPQRRARLQVAILAAIAAADSDHIPSEYELLHESELRSLRERAAVKLQIERGELWYWQGDGHDFPGSLSCPVVMSAGTLRELIAAPPAPAAVPVDAVRELAESQSAYDAAKAAYRKVSEAVNAAGGRSACGAAYDVECRARDRRDAAIAALIAAGTQPAAQGVDLGKLRAIIQSGATLFDAGFDGRCRAKVDEALAWIDAQHQQKESGDV